MVSLLFKALLPLLLIFALLFGALFFLRKYSFKSKYNNSSLINIKVISNKMIMPKKFISVIRIENKLLVLGLSEHSITVLKELEPPEGSLNDYNKLTEKESFIDLFKKNIGLK